MTLDAKQVGKAMRRARVLAGMTVHELAEASQIVEATVYNCEFGRTMPGLWTLCHIADALDISLDELVGRREGNHEARMRTLLYAMRTTADRIAFVTDTAMENLKNESSAPKEKRLPMIGSLGEEN